jgi:glycine cleavage system regulatory protein
LTQSLVLTLIGADRPGLVEALSRVVAEHGANWLESRMSRLAGKFAGILMVEVPAGSASALTAALEALGAEGLHVVVEASEVDAPPGPAATLDLRLVGQDRPGIVRDVARALAERKVNVEDLSTGCTSAPMSGETLFHAEARLKLPPGVSVGELRGALEALANDLMVDLTLDRPDES